jgi:hypothetical protein
MADDEQPRSRLAGTKRKANSALDAGGDEAAKRRHCEFLGLTFFTSALVVSLRGCHTAATRLPHGTRSRRPPW